MKECNAACVASVQCRDCSALEQSRRPWLVLMKASQARGPAGIHELRLTARILGNTLSNIAKGKAEQHKDSEAEVLLREALSVSQCLSLLHVISRHNLVQ